MQIDWKKWRGKMEPYKSILFFLGLVFFFHFSWKITIDGDMHSDRIWFLGKDITPDWFYAACRMLTTASGWFVKLFPASHDLVLLPTALTWPQGGGLRIIWGCTGIKQMTIFCGAMIFYRLLPWAKYQWNKLWYIPAGCILLTIYNVIRIGSISLLTKAHPEKFESLHDGIFRYIYYTIIFILWVIWEEFWVRKQRKAKE